MIIPKSDKSIGYQFSIEKHRNHAAMGPKGDSTILNSPNVISGKPIEAMLDSQGREVISQGAVADRARNVSIQQIKEEKRIQDRLANPFSLWGHGQGKYPMYVETYKMDKNKYHGTLYAQTSVKNIYKKTTHPSYPTSYKPESLVKQILKKQIREVDVTDIQLTD